jgi:hypothetical protein
MACYAEQLFNEPVPCASFVPVFISRRSQLLSIAYTLKCPSVNPGKEREERGTGNPVFDSQPSFSGQRPLRPNDTPTGVAPSTINHQPSTTFQVSGLNFHPSLASQLSTINYFATTPPTACAMALSPPSTINHQPSTINHLSSFKSQVSSLPCPSFQAKGLIHTSPRATPWVCVPLIPLAGQRPASSQDESPFGGH